MHQAQLNAVVALITLLFSGVPAAAPAHGGKPQPLEQPPMQEWVRASIVADDQDAITASCSITVPTPTLAGGIVSSNISVSCTQAVTAIEVTGMLTKNGSYVTSTTNTCEAQNWCPVVVSSPSSAGTWHAWGEGRWLDTGGWHTIPRERSPDCLVIL